jgi:hypothetical protein
MPANLISKAVIEQLSARAAGLSVAFEVVRY